MKVSLATFPIVFVAIESIVPPINPPTRGTALPRFTEPFSPNFVRRRKPTFWFILVIVFPVIFFITFVVSFFPIIML